MSFLLRSKMMTCLFSIGPSKVSFEKIGPIPPLSMKFVFISFLHVHINNRRKHVPHNWQGNRF